MAPGTSPAAWLGVSVLFFFFGVLGYMFLVLGTFAGLVWLLHLFSGISILLFRGLVSSFF